MSASSQAVLVSMAAHAQTYWAHLNVPVQQVLQGKRVRLNKIHVTSCHVWTVQPASTTPQQTSLAIVQMDSQERSVKWTLMTAHQTPALTMQGVSTLSATIAACALSVSMATSANSEWTTTLVSTAPVRTMPRVSHCLGLVWGVAWWQKTSSTWLQKMLKAQCVIVFLVSPETSVKRTSMSVYLSLAKMGQTVLTRKGPSSVSVRKDSEVLSVKLTLTSVWRKTPVQITVLARTLLAHSSAPVNQVWLVWLALTISMNVILIPVWMLQAVKTCLVLSRVSAFLVSLESLVQKTLMNVSPVPVWTVRA